MKIIGITIGLLVFLLVAVLVTSLARAKPHTRHDAVQNSGPWTNLGTVSNGVRSGLVMRRQDPDTGAMIYVLIGTELGGIYVLPAPAPEKAK